MSSPGSLPPLLPSQPSPWSSCFIGGSGSLPSEPCWLPGVGRPFSEEMGGAPWPPHLLGDVPQHSGHSFPPLRLEGPSLLWMALLADRFAPSTRGSFQPLLCAVLRRGFSQGSFSTRACLDPWAKILIYGGVSLAFGHAAWCGHTSVRPGSGAAKVLSSQAPLCCADPKPQGPAGRCASWSRIPQSRAPRISAARQALPLPVGESQKENSPSSPPSPA